MFFYDWSGSKILKYPVVENRRFIRKGDNDIPIPMDIRQWLTPSECWELRNKAEELFKDSSARPMMFDRRAWLCWKYVVDGFTYAPDANKDLWQLPSETLAREEGDCEDLSFLLASLLLVSGISPYCIRVVFGQLSMYNEQTMQLESKGTHAWVIYKNESGHWCLIDPTINAEDMPPGEHWYELGFGPNPFGIQPRHYVPRWCCNRDHVWAIDPTIYEWGNELYMDTGALFAQPADPAIP